MRAGGSRSAAPNAEPCRHAGERSSISLSSTAGDRIRPLGLGGTKKLQDVFVDAKVPRAERSVWPLLTGRGRILWVPGLVRSEEALASERSERLLVVEARRVAAPIPMC